MPGRFQENGIAFQYPESWKLTREEREEGWIVEIQSPGPAFLLVTFDPETPEIETMAQTALDAMKAEYDSLEFEETYETFAGQPSFGHEMRFFSFDLTNTCWTRSFYIEQGTVLIFWQANDLELESFEPVVQAILASMKVDPPE